MPPHVDDDLVRRRIVAGIVGILDERQKLDQRFRRLKLASTDDAYPLRPPRSLGLRKPFAILGGRHHLTPQDGIEQLDAGANIAAISVLDRERYGENPQPPIAERASPKRSPCLGGHLAGEDESGTRPDGSAQP